MKKYNHAYTIAFSVDTDNDAESPNEDEIKAALLKRIEDCDYFDMWLDAIEPYDTSINPQPKRRSK